MTNINENINETTLTERQEQFKDAWDETVWNDMESSEQEQWLDWAEENPEDAQELIDIASDNNTSLVSLTKADDEKHINAAAITAVTALVTTATVIGGKMLYDKIRNKQQKKAAEDTETKKTKPKRKTFRERRIEKMAKDLEAAGFAVVAPPTPDQLTPEQIEE